MTTQMNDEMLEQLWETLEDIPMDPQTECLEEAFLTFPAGTHREEVWRWFDERYSKGVAYLLYSDGVDRTHEIAQLYYRKQLCKDCDAEHCVFNPDGVCLFPMVSGRVPDLNDDGCRDFCCQEDTAEIQ